MKRTVKRLTALLLAGLLVLEGAMTVSADTKADEVINVSEISEIAETGEDRGIIEVSESVGLNTEVAETSDVADFATETDTEGLSAGLLGVQDVVTVEEVKEVVETSDTGNTVSNGSDPDTEVRPRGTYYQGYEPERVSGENISLLGSGGSTPIDSLPTKYDGREVTDNLPNIESQGSFGLCWVFGSLANAEAYAIRNSIADVPAQKEVKDSDDNITSYTPIFSPWMFYYYFTHGVNDPLKLIGGDIARKVGGKGHWGGTAAEAALFMSGWCQPVNEDVAAEAAYPLSEDADNYDYKSLYIPEDYAYQNSKVVLDHAYSFNKSDKKLIQQQVVDTGVVSVAYRAGGDDKYGNEVRRLPNTTEYGDYAGQATLFNKTVLYRIKDDGTIYGRDNPEPLNPNDANHAVAIVGYDDDFPKGYFNDGTEGLMPENNGAWLIRNSWGQDLTKGDDGYFWISYEDPTICNIWSMNFAPYSILSYNYHYDGTGNDSAHITLDSGSEIANVFYIQKARQYLKSVTVPLASANVDYEVKVYKVSERSAAVLDTELTAANLLDSVSGTTGPAGIINIALNESVHVTSDMTVAVVIKLSKADSSKVEVVTDKTFGGDDAYHEPKVNASFYKSGSKWYDLTEDRDITPSTEDAPNWRIKLITTEDSYLTTDLDYAKLFYNSEKGTGDAVTANISITSCEGHNQDNYVYEVCSPDGTVLSEEQYKKIVTLKGYTDRMEITAAGPGHVIIRYYNMLDTPEGSCDDFYSACTEVIVNGNQPKITLKETDIRMLTGESHKIDYEIENLDMDRFRVCYETKEDYFGISLNQEDGTIKADYVPTKGGGSMDPIVPAYVRVVVLGSNDDSEVITTSQWISVYVTEKIEVTGILFDEYSVTLFENQTFTPKVTITPEDYNENLYWSSDNEDVAVVSTDGVVTAKDIGRCRITLSTKRNPENPPEGYQEVSEMYSSFDVEVKEPDPVPITGIKFEKDTLRVKAGSRASAKLTVTPATNNDEILYRTSNENIATVDADGNITGVRSGSCVITAVTSYKLLTAFITVTVYTESSSGGGSGGGGGGIVISGGTSAKSPANVPSWVIKDGTWDKLPNGTWKYKRGDGSFSANEWLCVYNPYANVANGQRAYDWFRFDANGIMITGWFTDTDGNRYYLSPVSDGTMGRMYVGKQVVDGVTYYFNDLEGSGTMGALMAQTR